MSGQGAGVETVRWTFGLLSFHSFGSLYLSRLPSPALIAICIFSPSVALHLLYFQENSSQ